MNDTSEILGHKVRKRMDMRLRTESEYEESGRRFRGCFEMTRA